MIIVDAHAHLGPCTVFDIAAPADEVIRTMDDNGIDAAILQPYPGAPDAMAVHNEIAELAKKYPGRIFGIASINPRFLGKERYFAEVERCIKDLGFVGVKLHTIGHAISPVSEIGGWVFEAANKFKVPIQVHTGTGIPFALASACIPRAIQYPDLPIVIVHSGWVLVSPDAYGTAKACPNIYMETSWSIGSEIEWWVNDLGANRIMFGADLPNNRAAELAKYRALNLTDKQFEQVLGRTALDVYKLKVTKK
jgi:predicted TIM-barrel fold metal-dependent hydrolase